MIYHADEGEKGQLNQTQQLHCSVEYEKHCPRKVIMFILLSMLATRVIFFLVYAIQFSGTEMISFKGFLEASNIWDSNWYTIIIQDGYERTATGQAAWAFFPLYPLTVRAVSSVTHLSVNFSGFLVSNVCCFFASVYGWKYCMLSRKSEDEALFYTLLMIWGPCGFYESLLYTEAMYLMWLSMCFYYLGRHEYLKMGICGALCSATRNTGAFFVFTILFHVIHEYRQSGRSWKGFLVYVFCNARLLLGTMLVPLGIFCYMLYLYVRVGDALAFVNIQKAFMKDTHPGMLNVFLRANGLYGHQVWYWIYLILLTLMLILLLWNHHNDERIWGVINWLLPLQRGFGSVHRYMHTCVAAEMAFSDLCMKFGKKFRIVVLIIAFAAECVLMQQWLAGNGMLV